MIKGSITALVTPFKDGGVDEKAFQDFIEWQIENGIHGLVPCGTTGETPTLTDTEHKRVIELCCLLYTSPSPRDKRQSRMPSSA